MTAGAVDFTVIVPSFRRPRQLRGCLKWIARLARPRGGFEVVVVDDGSPEPLDDVVQPFRSELELRLLRQARAGPAAARNLGAEAARGSYLAFLDDDCRPAKNWLVHLAATLAEHRDELVGGQTINRMFPSPYSAASQLIVDMIYLRFNTRKSPIGFFTSNNFALDAELFRDIGGFDARFRRAAGEDREMCDRWLASGRRLRYQPEAIVHHLHRLDLARFVKQHLGYGRSAHLYHRIRSCRGQGRLPVDLGLHVQLLKRLLSPVPGRSFIWQSQVGAALTLSQMAYLAGFAIEKLQATGLGPVESDQRPSQEGHELA